MTRSLFTGDHATSGSGSAAGDADGGGIGIRPGGTVTLANDTITGETVTSADATGGGTGGLSGYARGGGISMHAAVLIQGSNLTIASNSAVAGAGAPGGASAAVGGGIHLFNYDGRTFFTNTILSGNTATLTTANCDGLFASTDHGNNLEFNPSNTCAFTSGTPKNDQFGDPKLDTLKNNGGPTQTLALLTGSAATGNGNPTTCAAAPVSGVDQRGLPRPSGSCAIGAFEPQTGPPNPLPPIQPTVSVVVNTPQPLPTMRPTGVPITNATPLPLPPRRP
ncbi:MAG: choice-of-anchor Q domain-containing protein [Thermomicrobiales bacterium]